MNRAQRVEHFSQKCEKFLEENELNLTCENIRRYFDFAFGKLPSERAINQIYKMIKGRQKS